MFTNVSARATRSNPRLTNSDPLWLGLRLHIPRKSDIRLVLHKLSLNVSEQSLYWNSFLQCSSPPGGGHSLYCSKDATTRLEKKITRHPAHTVSAHAAKFLPEFGKDSSQLHARACALHQSNINWQQQACCTPFGKNPGKNLCTPPVLGTSIKGIQSWGYPKVVGSVSYV